MLSFFFPGLRQPKQEPSFGGAAASDEQLNIGLERLCRLPRRQPGHSITFIPDDQIHQVAQVLRVLDAKHGRTGGDAWSYRPRTYIILWNVSGIDRMPKFVRSSYTDYHLPYENRTLPDFIDNDVMRQEFLSFQVHLLTSAKKLESLSHQSLLNGVLPHINFDGPGDRHFFRIRNLGQGGFGAVDEVLSMLSLHRYARKRVARGRHSSEANRKAQEYLVKELTDLKTLSHRHLVKLLGSYTDPEYIAFLMVPVAEGNLYDFLRQSGGLSDHDRHDVRKFFGCLAGAVHYLHGRNIRHRDLSSRNVLICQGTVYISDLGSAYKWANNATQGSITQDRNTPITIEYMAPEIAKHQPRSSSSDMWSLGVVYLEMATALVGRTIPQLQTHVARKVAGRRLEPYIWANPPVVNSWVNELQLSNHGPKHDNEPLLWIRDLLQELPNNRPKSKSLMQDILESPSFSIFCCINCQPEFRDRKFAYSDMQTVQEQTLETPIDMRETIVDMFKQEEPRSVLTDTKTHSIENWLAATETNIPRHDSFMMPGSFTFDDIEEREATHSPPLSDASFASANEENTLMPKPILLEPLPPPLDLDMLDVEIEETPDVVSITPVADDEDAKLYSTLNSMKPRKERSMPKQVRLRDTGLGFFEYDSSSSDEDNEISLFNESEDSSGSESDSEATVKPSTDQDYGPDGTGQRILITSTDEQHEWLRVLDNIPTEDVEAEPDNVIAVVSEMKGFVDPRHPIEGHADDKEVQERLLRTNLDVPSSSSTEELSRDSSVKQARASVTKTDRPHGGHESDSSGDSRVAEVTSKREEAKAPSAAPEKPKIAPGQAKVTDQQSLTSTTQDPDGAERSDDKVPISSESSPVSLRTKETNSKRSAVRQLRVQTEATKDDPVQVQPGYKKVEPAAAIPLNTAKATNKSNIKPASSISKSSSPPNLSKDIQKSTKTSSNTPSTPRNNKNAKPAKESTKPALQAQTVRTESSTKANTADTKRIGYNPSWLTPPPQTATRGEPRNTRLPGLSASTYIEDTWESASSVATSVMSEDTGRLLKGFNLNKWWDKDYGLLEKYCSKGSVAAIRVLLDQGCNPGRPPGSKQGRRIGPIFNAIKGASLRHNKCVRELLDRGADPNVKSNRTGKTPLHAAIENRYFRGYEHLVRMLIEAGADTNQPDSKDDRPIMKIFYGNETGPLEDHRRKALALLLRDPTTKVDMVLPGTLNTPLHLAIRRRDALAVGMLVYRAADVNAKNASGSTPLLLVAGQFQGALSTEHTRILDFLLESKDIAVDEKGGFNEQTALHYAVKASAAAAVSMLLNYGADASIKDSEGNDSFALAMKSVSKEDIEQHVSIMTQLMDLLGTPWPVDRKNCLIDSACAEQTGSLMSTLLTRGLNANLIKGGQTLLHLAIVNKNRTVAGLLVKHGAIVDSKNAEGIRAVKLAIQMRQNQIAKKLVKNGRYLKEENKALDTAEVNRSA